jgi:hypothetical protein
MLEPANPSDEELFMKSSKSVGRSIGMLLLVHLATGLTVPYILLQRLTTQTGFLTSAAEMSFQVRLAVLLLFVGGAIPVAIVIAAWPIIRQLSYAFALWLLALAVINFSLQGVENANWMTMLSLSQEYARAGAADTGLFQALGVAVRSSWKWAHYTHLLVVVGWMFVLSSLLYRFTLVPRALAAVGMGAALLQLSGITLPQFVGYSVRFPELFGIPLGLSYLSLALWLMIRGIEEGHGPLRAELHEAELEIA